MQKKEEKKLHTCFMSSLDVLVLQLIKDFFLSSSWFTREPGGLERGKKRSYITSIQV
jgi:hypothetical protein